MYTIASAPAKAHVSLYNEDDTLDNLTSALLLHQMSETHGLYQ
jgi:hypothetical protein